MICHRLKISHDFLDDLNMTIQLPFPLQVGSELMVGSSADWNFFRVDTATWHTTEGEMCCWLEFVALLENRKMQEVRKFLLDEGWMQS